LLMLDIFKKPVTIIIIFVAIIIALGWSYYESWSESRKNSTTITDTTPVQIIDLATVDSAEFDETVRDEYALAKSKALEAKGSNTLRAIEIELPSVEINSGNNRYVFANPEDTENNWTITISQLTSNYIRASIPKNDYMGDLEELNTKLWKFNYVTALQLAESNGGLTFRENNSIASVKLILKHFSPNNWLLWHVTYTSTTDNEFSVKIDSNSGEIIEE